MSIAPQTPPTLIRRRRFLALSACALIPQRADAATWSGTGFGAALSLQLVGGSPRQTAHAFARVEREIIRIEAMASLYRDSSLTRLNRDGHLAYPSQDLLDLLALAGRVHAATDGVFDPTVQPLYLARATGQPPDHGLIGWDRVQIDAQEIRLGRGQALTLNGIAQGWAADRIAQILREAGFGQALIDMGEVQALGMRAAGTPWRGRIETPEGQALAEVSLTDRALATSSPYGTRIGAQGLPHILGPQGQDPVWNTVSVSAPSAALADALSTAFCLMSKPAIDRALTTFPQARLEAVI